MSFPKTYTFKAIFIAEACDALSLHLYGMEQDGEAIPAWLNDAAESRGVNYSQILQAALNDYLGVYHT